jgi:hypothetical protein
MGKGRRLLWEAVIALLLLAVIWGGWKWSAVHTASQLAARQAVHDKATAALRDGCSAWASRLAESQAEAVFRAFAAGLQPAVMAGREEAVLQAKNRLLELPQVAFVHLLAPDGSVMVSSDEKYTTTGHADDRAAWALATRDLTVRTGDLPGTTEVAAPILGSNGPVAILWLGYKTRGLEETTRPESLAPPAPAG